MTQLYGFEPGPAAADSFASPTVKEGRVACSHEILVCSPNQMERGLAVCEAEDCGLEVAVRQLDGEIITEVDGNRQWKRIFNPVGVRNARGGGLSLGTNRFQLQS